jgi:hypothetical protein
MKRIYLAILLFATFAASGCNPTAKKKPAGVESSNATSSTPINDVPLADNDQTEDRIVPAVTNAGLTTSADLSKAQTSGSLIYGLKDRYTGENVNLKKISSLPKGKKVDNVIYFKPFTKSGNNDYYARVMESTVNVKWYGAKGDHVADDSNGIEKALNSGFNVLFDSGLKFKTTRLITIDRVNNFTVFATGATIYRFNIKQGAIRIVRCNNITFQGGTYTCAGKVSEGSDSEHTFMFQACKNVIINGITVDKSPQMGICLMNVIGATVKNNRIRNTFRDGVYSHYGTNIKYLNNTLQYIKDDALSMHDYGIAGEKPELLAIGLKNAGNSLISGNTISHCMQGISSIGLNGLKITNNNIKHTVSAGIAVFNSALLKPNGDATPRNITITGNMLNKTGGKQTFLGRSYTNGGQLGTGRAAICVEAQGPDNLYTSSTEKLYKVNVSNNTITESYINAVFCYSIDGLVLKNNKATNCNIDQSNFTGRIFEIYSCNDVVSNNNTAVDTRAEKKHNRGYSIQNSRIKNGTWTIKGFTDASGTEIDGVSKMMK